MRRILCTVALCGLATSLVLGLAGCSPEAAKSSPAAAKSDPPEVTVSRPVEKLVTDYVDFTGRTEAIDTVEIRARVTGFLESRDFEEGDEVEKGKLLFVIDVRPYKADQDAAKAAVDQAMAQQALKTADYNRVKILRDKGQVSQEEFERAAAQKLEATAQVAKAEADLEKANLNVEFCSITSPLAGLTSKALLSNGNLVTADTTQLTTIVSVEAMYVYFDADEPTMLRFQNWLRQAGVKSIREGGSFPVYLGLASEPGQHPHKGFIDFRENRLNPNTGTIRVRARFENPKPEKGPRLLMPGLFARIRLPFGGEYAALHVPEQAIGTDQGRKFVYVVDSNNRVASRPITVGPVRNGSIVVREGLTKDDRVVVKGLQRVRPNSIVKPTEVAPESDKKEAEAKAAEKKTEGE